MEALIERGTGFFKAATITMTKTVEIWKIPKSRIVDRIKKNGGTYREENGISRGGMEYYRVIDIEGPVSKE